MDEVSLAGVWMVRADPDGRGLDAGWADIGTWAAEGRTIELPGAMQKSLGADHKGVSWVARAVELPKEWGGSGQRQWLHFECVATDATVWVNGKLVGRHVGDYIPFQFEITDAVSGLNEAAIVVRVDQMHAPRPAPGVLTENGHITKGFHDVLSLQHSGVWGGVSLRRTGGVALVPRGVRFIPRGEELEARVEIAPGSAAGTIEGTMSDYDCRRIFMWSEKIAAGQTESVSRGRRPMLDGWAPDSQALYEVEVMASDASGRSDSIKTKFGSRSIATGGPDHSRILLNGKPLLIRGVLHWGHEPDRMAPAPTRGQVRDELLALKELGFNCVCLCMWYPPEYYFDIADDLGMLIWQEHPVWKSPMEEELIPEYKRLFEEFFRRDARHPSVIIVSGSCEHERIHPELAAWWWRRAKELLPDKLVQVQTAFIGWTNPEQTDLHDEHVYDSSGRWVKFVDDVQATIKELPPKPFVMGETIIGTAWGDTSVAGGKGEWWYPKGVEECRAFETRVRERYGEKALDEFVRGARRQNVEIRKFQSEVLRSFAGCAGWVMNQIRDVPVGRLGFMDDFGKWRFAAEDTRSWLGDVALLLRTPEHRRGFAAGAPIEAEIGVSNFGRARIDGPVRVSRRWRDGPEEVAIACGPGDVRFGALRIESPRVEYPARITVEAKADGAPANEWKLWVFPEPGDVPPGTVRMDGLPYSKKEMEPDFEERAYSSGWGLKCRTWTPLLPHPEQAVFKAPVWRFDAPMPKGTRVVVTHQITRGLLEFMEAGGRVVLLANKTGPGLSAKFINAWGQTPLIPYEPPLDDGSDEWIIDLLHIDLLYRHPRAIAVEDLGILDQVDPIVRLVFTHDRGVPKMFDAAFRTRVGQGLLVASSLDHSGGPGRWLLHRLLQWSAEAEASTGAQLDTAWLGKVARV